MCTCFRVTVSYSLMYITVFDVYMPACNRFLFFDVHLMHMPSRNYVFRLLCALKLFRNPAFPYKTFTVTLSMVCRLRKVFSIINNLDQHALFSIFFMYMRIIPI